MSVASSKIDEFSIYNVLISAIMTEKASHTAVDKHDVLVFRVDPRANKIQVKAAVEKIFKLKVKLVTILNVAGKKKRVGRHIGTRRNWKKAYIRLMPGHQLDLMSGDFTLV